MAVDEGGADLPACLGRFEHGRYVRLDVSVARCARCGRVDSQQTHGSGRCSWCVRAWKTIATDGRRRLLRNGDLHRYAVHPWASEIEQTNQHV